MPVKVIATVKIYRVIYNVWRYLSFNGKRTRIVAIKSQILDKFVKYKSRFDQCP